MALALLGVALGLLGVALLGLLGVALGLLGVALGLLGVLLRRSNVLLTAMGLLVVARLTDPFHVTNLARFTRFGVGALATTLKIHIFLNLTTLKIHIFLNLTTFQNISNIIHQYGGLFDRLFNQVIYQITKGFNRYSDFFGQRLNEVFGVVVHFILTIDKNYFFYLCTTFSKTWPLYFASVRLLQCKYGTGRTVFFLRRDGG